MSAANQWHGTLVVIAYHRHRHQRTNPTRRSARAQRDDQLRVEIQRVYDEHQQVYGPRKVWKQLRRDGIRVARCTVARLMRAMGGAGRSRTCASSSSTRPTTGCPRQSCSVGGAISHRWRPRRPF